MVPINSRGCLCQNCWVVGTEKVLKIFIFLILKYLGLLSAIRVVQNTDNFFINREYLSQCPQFLTAIYSLNFNRIVISIAHYL